MEKGTKGMLFIVNFGGQIMRWALDGVTEIGKAISWVMDEVLDIGAKIIDWLGFLFNWKDIQATHNSLVAVVNGGLQAGADRLGVISQQIDAFFVNLETTVRNATYPDVLTGQTANAQSDQGSIVAAEQANISSTKGNWTKYQFKHGGAATASTIASSDSGDPMFPAWSTLVEPAVASLSNTCETLATDLVQLFQSGGKSLSVGQVLQKLGADVLIGIIEVVRTLVVGLVKLGSLALQDLRAFVNYEINMPVFSALYKEFISGGAALTLLDGLCMLVAIPVTIMSKLLTGNAPPDMTALNYGDLVDGKITDAAQRLQINKFMSVSHWSTAGFRDVVGLIAALTTVAEEPHEKPAPPSCEPPEHHPHHRRHHHRPGGKHKHKHHHRHRHLSRCAATELGATDTFTELDIEHIKLGFSLIGSALAFPTEPEEPGYPQRVISWLIGISNTLIATAVRRVVEIDHQPPAAREKALAVLHAALSLINFALACDIAGLEFTTEDYPGKDPAFTTLECFQSVFELLASMGEDGAVLAVGEFCCFCFLELLSWPGRVRERTETDHVEIWQIPWRKLPAKRSPWLGTSLDTSSREVLWRRSWCKESITIFWGPSFNAEDCGVASVIQVPGITAQASKVHSGAERSSVSQIRAFVPAAPRFHSTSNLLPGLTTQSTKSNASLSPKVEIWL